MFATCTQKETGVSAHYGSVATAKKIGVTKKPGKNTGHVKDQERVIYV